MTQEQFNNAQELQDEINSIDGKLDSLRSGGEIILMIQDYKVRLREQEVRDMLVHFYEERIEELKKEFAEI